MKPFLPPILILLLLSSPISAAELTLKEAEDFLANVEQLYEPPDEELNRLSEQAVKESPELAELLTPSEGYYYPAVDIYRLWKKAGIKPKPLWDDSHEFLFGYRVGTEKKWNIPNPEAKLYSNGDFKVLRINSSLAFSRDYQFLFFKKRKDEWAYFDYTYALFENYTVPEVTFLDDELFYINELGASGTNLVGFINTLYAISDDKVEPLLYCPNEGYLSGWGRMFNLKYESNMDYSDKVLTLNYTIDVDADTYTYEPKEGEGKGEFPLFTANRKVVFNWDGADLSLDKEGSQFSMDELENIFGGGQKEYYAMFQAEFDAAKDGNAEQKEWYGLFMKVINE
ncbi:MAG: hypothetical protein ABIC18_05130 [Candidatus Omnitrophota bacterium]